MKQPRALQLRTSLWASAGQVYRSRVVKSNAFTLVELLVVLAMVVTLVVLLLPVFSRSREKARQVTCVSNLRQIGIAIYQYAQDNNDIFPYAGDPSDIYVNSWKNSPWANVAPTLPLLPVTLTPYIKEVDVWRCPDDTGYTEVGAFEDFPLTAIPSAFTVFGMSYGYDTYLALLQQNVATVSAWDQEPPHAEYGPDHIILLQDMNGSWHGGRKWEDKRYNVLFCDGHVHYTNRTDDSNLWNQTFIAPPNS